MTKAKGEVEIKDLQRRAAERWINEETRKQLNMESITAKAIPHINDDAPAEDIQEDWIADFFDKCRLISDEDMQDLWARVLAGEVNSPGKFSKRTLNFLASTDKKDAEKFQSMCQFLWSYNNKTSVVIIFDSNDEIVKSAGFNFGVLQHFESIGLLGFQFLASYIFFEDERSFTFEYHGKKLQIQGKVSGEKWEVEVGQIMLSQIGEELASIQKIVPNWSYFEYCKREFEERSGGVILLESDATTSR